MGFHISRALSRALASWSPESSAVSSLAGSTGADYGDVTVSVSIAADGGSGDEKSDVVLSFQLRRACRDMGEVVGKEGGEEEKQEEGLPVVKQVTLASIDGYFFYDASQSGPGGDLGLALEHRVRARAVCDMVAFNFLKPAVIVLQGDKEGRQTVAAALVALWQRAFGAKRLHTREVTVLSDDDKHVVMGNTKEIRGGLFKFIDEVTNPAVYKERQRRRVDGDDVDRERGCVLVHAHVNELGQYIMREVNTHPHNYVKPLSWYSASTAPPPLHPFHTHAHAAAGSG
jgi:hypothetical protein